MPLHRNFDFTVPDGIGVPEIGVRVRVPFGRRHLVGIVIQHLKSSDIPADRLRDIAQILDTSAIFSNTLFDWLHWIAAYYHHPLGEVLHTALPVAVRRGQPLVPKQARYFRLTEHGRSARPEFTRAPLQKRIWQALQEHPALSPTQLQNLGRSWHRAIETMTANGLVEVTRAPPPANANPGSGPELNADQTQAVKRIVRALGGFKSFVLFGVTGSGKTEIYLQVIQRVITSGKQVLVLVPEIGLTPQLVRRFEQRIEGRLVVLHSNLSTGERHRAWASARDGSAAIVLGTRSAVFTPMLKPGLIVIDEEHDISLKQQDGLRYHARDIAVLRAKLESVPIVLGSATPSFESVSNVMQARYEMLRLNKRVQGANLPRIECIDMRKAPVEQGLSRNLIDALAQRLAAGEQSLVFVNRRGYAPVLYCAACGWQAACGRCDTKMIYHKTDQRLRCHHCGTQSRPPERCPQCNADSILPLGAGTQRLESHLEQLFPSAKIVRIDRDSTRRSGELELKLNQAASGEADILVGTQLLAKGHHFPMVTLVGIVDADQGLYSVDFRATEYLFQQIVQVAGRAGRADNPGQVLIQTIYPDHFHFRLLQAHDYTGFTDIALQERLHAQHPPYAFFVLLRAESVKPGGGLEFLARAGDIAASLVRSQRSPVQVMEPVPSPMEKRAGRYRAQLLLSSPHRPALHRLLDELVPGLERCGSARYVRWSVDVDPMEMY